jgi:transposase InsO family protein
MAVYQRRPGEELVHYSDKGSQHLSIRYTEGRRLGRLVQPHRIHRALGDIPPAEYETNHYASIKAAALDRS